MSEAPEKIRTNAAGNAIVTPHPVWDTDVEYIRADVAQAMVAAAYEDAANTCFHPKWKPKCSTDWVLARTAGHIRYHVQADASAALDAMLAKAREDALREAAEMVNRNLGKPAHHAHAAIIALIHTGEDT